MAELDDEFFRVTNFTATEAVLQEDGAVVEANATVRNDGGLSGTQTIRFEAGGDVLDTNESVQLDAGESIEQNFTVNASELDTGSQQIGIFTENASRTTTITVSEPEPAELQVDIDEVSAGVQQGAPVDVNVTVENVGDLEAENESIALDLSVAGEPVALDSANVTLAGGESTTLTLSDTVDPLPRAGAFDGTVEVTAGDATDTAATKADTTATSRRSTARRSS